ncbi:hypothetical protein H0H87_005482 [Tephrocybe sp. NHM501043]|nr:hypothetical protein H0H87_005482 [Tephrocybe sp. NHM501043]
MDKIKNKIKSKFTKTPSEKPRRNPKLRHSASMPMRISFESDIHEYDEVRGLIPHFEPIYSVRYPDWPSANVPDPNDFSRPYNPRMHADRILLDQFPKPPTTVPVSHSTPPLPPMPVTSRTRAPPKRPNARPPTQDFSQIPTEHLLPDFPPELTAKIRSLDAEQARHQKEKHAESAKAARNAAILRARQAQGQAIQRSTSNTSQYPTSTRPLNIRRRDVLDPDATPKPSGGPYKNYAASKSALSLRDPNSRDRYHACLASSRQATAKEAYSSDSSSSNAHTNYDSETSLYTNSSASKSSYSVSTHTQYQSDLAASGSKDSIPRVDDTVSVRRRNASSASSRSALAMRRHGLMPPPSHTAGEQAQHGEMLRVLRGPHAAQFQAPSVPMRAQEIGLPINDTLSEKEWGAKGSKFRGAATVAGYGHGAYDRRH